MTNITGTFELFGAMVGKFSDSAYAELSQDPKSILSKLNINLDADVKVVNNTADTMNIALPYYADLEKSAGAVLSESDLEAASGGAGAIAAGNGAATVSSMTTVTSTVEVNKGGVDEIAVDLTQTTASGRPTGINPNK